MSITTENPRTNGVDTAALFATLDAVKGQPEIAKFQFRTSNTWLGGTHSRSTFSDFYGAMQEMAHKHVTEVESDHPAVLVGQDEAPSPVEYVLHAIAACLTAGIANVAAARGVQLHQGQLDRRGRHRSPRHPRALRRQRPERLPADQGDLPHRGRRRRRDVARHRRAVPPPVGRLRRADPAHPVAIEVVTG